MPSGNFRLALTWKPIEEATTPWVPNLKPMATELSKNITTTAVSNASNLNANLKRALLSETLPGANCRLPMSFLIGVLATKHYPLLINPASS